MDFQRKQKLKSELNLRTTKNKQTNKTQCKQKRSELLTKENAL